MPIIEVTIQAVSDEGDPIWAYAHRACVPAPPQDAEENALRLAEALMSRVEDGKQSVALQIASDVSGGLAEAQAAAGECPDCRHSVPLHMEEGGCTARVGVDRCKCRLSAAEALARG